MSEYDRVEYLGLRMTRRQRQALQYSVKHWQHGSTVYGIQGSWQPQTWYSGTTHTDAGVVDIGFYGMGGTDEESSERRHAFLRILRREGCQAAFLRGPFCDMPWHYHILDLDTHGMDSHPGYGAVWQVGEYRAGNDGLVAGRDDPYTYRPHPIRKWRFRS